MGERTLKGATRIGSACVLAFALQVSRVSAQTPQFSAAALAADACWTDAGTGKPVAVGPPGWSPTGLGGRLGENPDPNHVVHGGHTFVRRADGSWIDASTGNPVLLGPPGWSPTGLGGRLGENPDPNHVVHGGHTFVRVPCPPPPGASSVPMLPILPFGLSIGLGHRDHGDDRFQK
jgi:hypothetical protein